MNQNKFTTTMMFLATASCASTTSAEPYFVEASNPIVIEYKYTTSSNINSMIKSYVEDNYLKISKPLNNLIETEIKSFNQIQKIGVNFIDLEKDLVDEIDLYILSRIQKTPSRKRN